MCIAHTEILTGRETVDGRREQNGLGIPYELFRGQDRRNTAVFFFKSGKTDVQLKLNASPVSRLHTAAGISSDE